MAQELEQQTEVHAAELSAAFGSSEKQYYHKLTQTLIEQQKKPPSPEALATLPKLLKSDLPQKGQDVPTEVIEKEGVTYHLHPIFTSGIIYLDIGFDLSTVPQELLPYLSLYAELLTRCGAGKYNFEQMAKRITLSTGGIDASVSCRTRAGTEEDLFFYAFFHGKSLAGERFGEMLGILRDLFMSPDLENRKQIKDILFEERNGLHSSIISAGHQFAMGKASSFLSKARLIDEKIGGISQLRFLDELLREDAVDQVITSMKKLHDIIINRNCCVISITADNPSEYTAQLEAFIKELPSLSTTPSLMQFADLKGDTKPLAIEISSAVNFVAKVWKYPFKTPVDRGLAMLLARNLYTGYLWDKVRVEGGAYGGIASYSFPVFGCASYRDPNLTQTLKAFEAGLRETSNLDQDKVDPV
jgi:Zn-dependent M16 (insulinase) family peptidase